MNCSCGAAGTCGACSGVTQRTPQPVSNRTGLPSISYRAGRQPDFLASLIAGLSTGDRPALAALRTRDPSDPTVALLDAFACVCDVLTFYTERLANESYLRTATDPISLRELGRLVGYQPSPGAAAQTYLAFSLERQPEMPASVPPDPGLVPPGVPGSVDLRAGLRVMSVPGPGQQPVTFETVEQITARPEWSSVPVVDTVSYPPRRGRRDAWLAGASLSLKTGDMLLFVGTRTGATGYGEQVVDHWNARVLTGVNADPQAKRTHVTWRSRLARHAPAGQPAFSAVFVLRTTAGVFGANAPQWGAMSADFRNNYPGGANSSEWPDFTVISSSGALDVEGSRPELVAGNWIVVESSTGRELYRVTGRTEMARAQYAISGRVTELTLAGFTHTFGSPRDVTVYGGGELLTITDAPDDSPVAAGTQTLTVRGDLSEMRPGRTLIAKGTTTDGATAAERLTLYAVTAAGGVSVLTLAAPGLRHSYQRDGLVVFGNVAKATHGVTVSQILGSGDAATAGQAFVLNATPITYVQASTVSGTAPTLEVGVDGATWHEVPTLYPSRGSDRVYVTDLDAAGKHLVVFGDGVHGSRLPTGTQNVRARYRQGLGAAGNLAAQALSQPLDRPLGLKAVTNPVPATGGVDPEGPATARRSIPISVLTLGRVVSVPDYASFALGFTGIAKAEATVLTLAGVATVVVTVAGFDGAALAQATVADLVAALRQHGDPHVAVTVLVYRRALFRIGARIAVAADRQPADVLAGVESAWRAAFSFPARSLGQPVFLSDVIATAQRVTGVAGVDLRLLYRTGDGASRQYRLLAAPAAVADDGTAKAAELLTLDPAPLDELERMP
jgi:predicted phage baseplate assembly protein